MGGVKFLIYLNRLVLVMSTDCSKAVPLLQFFILCASMVSYVTFILSLFVPQLSFFWCP